MSHMSVQSSKHEHPKKQSSRSTAREQRPQFLIGEIPQSHFRTLCGMGDIVVTNFGKIEPDIQLLNLLGCL